MVINRFLNGSEICEADLASIKVTTPKVQQIILQVQQRQSTTPSQEPPAQTIRKQ